MTTRVHRALVPHKLLQMKRCNPSCIPNPIRATFPSPGALACLAARRIGACGPLIGYLAGIILGLGMGRPTIACTTLALRRCYRTLAPRHQLRTSQTEIVHFWHFELLTIQTLLPFSKIFGSFTLDPL